MSYPVPTLHKFRGRGLTVPEIARITGLSESTVYRRIRLGKPIEGPCRYGPEPKRILFRGQLMTIQQISEATGLSRSQVSKRSDGKKFFEREDLADPHADPHPICVMLTMGNITDSVAGWAKRTGIPRHVISYRLDLKGWTVERILTTPSEPKPKLYTFRGNARTLKQWAHVTGLAYRALKSRIDQGMTIDRALTMPVLDHRNRKVWRRNRTLLRRMVILTRNRRAIRRMTLSRKVTLSGEKFRCA